MDKQQVLSNVENLTADQLSKYIIIGTVTREELMNTGLLDHGKRKIIKNLLDQQR